MTEAACPAPRFLSDEEICRCYGLSDRALTRLRATRGFPQKDGLIRKTDRRAVDIFFDRRLGLESSGRGSDFAVDGKENFHGI